MSGALGEAVVIVAQAAVLVAGMLAALRWPGRTLGPAVGLALWCWVAPWASLAGLAVTVAAVFARARWGRQGGLGLLRWPVLAAAIAGVVMVLFGPVGWVQLAGFGVLAVVVGWLARASSTSRVSAPEVSVPVVRDSIGPAALGAVGATERVVRWVPCELCGAVLETSAPLSGDPLWSLARASCGGCGVEFVGVLDSRPGAEPGVVWFTLPARQPSEPRDRRWVS